MTASNNRKQASTPNKRNRRTTEEVIDLLLEAARKEFERNGYAGTKTAAIARNAGVTEALIFTNFGSKAELFSRAIFQPLDRHFLEFCARHLGDFQTEDERIENVRQYVLELQQFIESHSRMLASLLFSQLYEGGTVEGLSDVAGLHDYFERATARVMGQLTDKPLIDPQLIARISFATTLACIVFKDVLFPPKLASKDQIRTAMTDFVINGLNANAGSTGDLFRSPPGPSHKKPGKKSAATRSASPRMFSPSPQKTD